MKRQLPTVCPRVTRLIVNKKKGYDIGVKHIIYSDLFKSRSETWDKNRNWRFENFGKTLRKYNFKNKSSLPKLIFRITLDLILRDIIDKKYVFKMPKGVGGYIGIFDISQGRCFNMDRFTYSWYQPIIADFRKNAMNRVIFRIKFNGKYRRKFMKNIMSGYKYQRRDGN